MKDVKKTIDEMRKQPAKFQKKQNFGTDRPQKKPLIKEGGK